MALCLVGLDRVISLIYYEHLKRHKVAMCGRPCRGVQETCRLDCRNPSSNVFVRLHDLPGSSV